jgi:O-antigen/teichoic acid export membrane protein
VRLRAAVSSSIASQLVTMASGLASVPLLLHAFGREQYGFWGALLSITAYLSLLNLGVAQTVSSGISSAAPGSEHTAPRLVQRGLRFYAKACGIAVPLVAALAMVSPWARWFGLAETEEWPSRIAACAVFVTFLLELPFSVFRAALYGAGQVATERLLGIGLILVRLAASWVFSVSHPPLWLAVIVLSTINVGSYLVALAFLKKVFPGLLSPTPPSSADSADLDFRAASRDFFILQIAGAMVWSTDALLAGLTLGAVAAAQVSAAWRVITIVLALGGVIAPAVAPLLTRLWISGEKAAANQLALEAAQVVFALMIVAMLGAASSGEAIFSLWLGDEMFAGEATWLAYCAVVAIQAVLVIPDSFITQSARHARYAHFTLLEAAIKISASVVLMHFVGLPGLPLGTILGRSLTTLWVLPSAFVAATEQRAIAWLTSVIRPSLLPIAVFGATFLIGTRALGFSTPVATLAVGTVSGSFFLFAYFIWGLPERLRARLRLVAVDR